MLELLQNVRPELLISWAGGIIMAIILFLNMPDEKEKSAKIPFKNSNNKITSYIEFIKHG